MVQPVLPEKIPDKDNKTAGQGYGICPEHNPDIPEKMDCR